MSNIEITNISVWNQSLLNAIHGMRMSFNSTHKSDTCNGGHYLGKNDKELMERLINSGASHSKFLRFIRVQFICKAPLKWWKHFDTYKYAEKLSQSTMHTLLAKPLTENDFAMATDLRSIEIVNEHIKAKNFERATDSLPDGFLQSRFVDTNYACLRNIYLQRKNHKLKEWGDFIRQIEKGINFPYLVFGEYNV